MTTEPLQVSINEESPQEFFESSPIMKSTNSGRSRRTPLPKTPTGIQGLDEITFGGLPKGRPTLVCGSAGCGKTLLSMEFLVHGATQFNEPGIFIGFEETEEDVRKNVASLVRNLPMPMKQITGDLSNTERVLVGLDLRPSPAAKR